jgi:ferredoxin-NADP reductase
VRHGGELMLKSHLEALAATYANFHLCFCFSDPRPDELAGRDYQQRGRIDVGLLRMLLPIKPYHFYICGPSAMLESLVPALEDWGVRESHIHFEAFGPASVKRRSAAATLEVESPGESSGIVVNFTRSGKQLAWPTTAASLLELAEASGVAVTSGCRAGGCGSCQTTIVSGAVSYRQPPDYDPEPGSCLLCVCTPKTSLSLEA